MAILERTPPRKRQTDIDPTTSSPSRSKLLRSPERQQQTAANETYVFPSLEALAAPVRERNAAMNHSTRDTPTLHSMTRSGSNIELNSGSKRTLSANSRKILGGPAGRNGPVLSVTVSKLHPALGERIGNNSPRPASKSAIPKPLQSPTYASRTERSMSPLGPHLSSRANDVYPSLPASFGDDDVAKTQAISINTAQDPNPQKEEDPFLAQMERALASGANPFQDRRREQMRGESNIEQRKPMEEVTEASPLPRHKPTPRNSNALGPLSYEAKIVSSTHSQAVASSIVDRTRPLTRSPVSKASTSLARTSSPSRAAALQIQAELQAQIEEKLVQIEKLKEEAAKYLKELKEVEKLNKKQKETINVLEKQFFDQSTRATEVTDDQILFFAFAWETGRAKCKDAILRTEERKEREIESIISRNEVTYLDARRLESELDLKMERDETERLNVQLRIGASQRKAIKSTLLETEKEKQALKREKLAIESREIKMKESLNREQEKIRTLEDGLNEANDRIAKMEAEAKELRKKQAQMEAKRVTPALDTRQNSSGRFAQDNDKENTSPFKNMADQRSKEKKTFSEAARQSPRKKITALVKSTSAKIHSSVSRRSDSVSEGDLEQGDSFYEEARKVSSLKGKQKDTKAKKSEIVEEDHQSEEEMELEEVVPKKKTSILSRAKKSGGKLAVQATRRSEEKAAVVETELETQQTPMIAIRKTKAKEQFVLAEEPIEEPSFVNATPIVKTRVKKVAATTIEEKTKGTKKRGAMVQEQVEVESSSKPISSEDGLQKKKKRRLLKPNNNVANGFLEGNVSGDLDPKLNLPLQLSPIKGDPPTATSTLGTRGGTSNRIFGR